MRRYVIPLVVIVLAACSDRELSGPDPSLDRSVAASGISVVSWNVYYGADLDVLLDEAIPLPVRTAMVLGQVMQTDAPARAAAIARRIAAERPHLVGLQEVAEYWRQSPGDLVLGGTEPASDEIFDFLDLLIAALASEGASYVVASRTFTLEAELPMVDANLGCAPCDDLRFRESVAILARSDVATSNPQQQLFQYNLPVEVAGTTLEILKGWASVDAQLKGTTYRFVTTHLEPADVLPGHEIHPLVHQIQLAQAAQLIGAAVSAEIPVILTGDLNTEPGGTSTAAYGMFMDAGFADTWLKGRPRGDGFTANQQADLTNAESQLWHRIDYVLYRDAFTARGVPFRGAVHAQVIGDRQADRTPGGLWPSDHAGVAAVLRMP